MFHLSCAFKKAECEDLFYLDYELAVLTLVTCFIVNRDGAGNWFWHQKNSV